MLLDLQLSHFPLEYIQLRGHGIDLGPHSGAGFVDEVDGLIGKKSIRNIPVGQGRGGNDGRVGDLHPVENLITLLQSTENGHCVLHGRLLHQHRLKPPLQSGILLYILSILIEGGGSYTVEFSPGQHGLQEVPGIHAALGLPCPHNGMEFVDEQQYPPLRAPDLIQNGLQPLLKLSPVLGPCNESAHVQVEDGLILERGGHISLYDPLGQPLRDGRLAHSGFPDQHRVILALSGENANDVSNLLIPPDHRVQLVLSGPFHQVGAVLFQCVIGLLRVVRGHPLVPPDRSKGGQHTFLSDPIGPQQLRQLPLSSLAQSQQQMLHRDILVPHLFGGLLGGAQGALCPRRNIDLSDLTAWAGDPGLPLHQGRYRGAEAGHRKPHSHQKLRDQAALRFQKGQQQMALLDLLAAILGGKGLGRLDGLKGLLSIII